MDDILVAITTLIAIVALIMAVMLLLSIFGVGPLVTIWQCR